MTEQAEQDWWHGYDAADWPDVRAFRKTLPDAERPVDVDDAEERDR